MAKSSQIARGFNSFSGVDIKAVFANKVLGEIQAISYSITREKAPIYTLGSADPRAFSRGKRGIAGTLIFIIFDRHPLLGTFGLYAPNKADQLLFLSDIDDIRPDAAVSRSLSSLTVSTGTRGTDIAETAIQGQESNITAVGLVSEDGDQEIAAPWYIDQVPAFDITLAAANEMGSLAVMAIYGVELINEGYGISIDDIVSEQQITYVARSIQPWRPVGNINLVSPSGAEED